MVTGSYQTVLWTTDGSQPSIGSNVFTQYGCHVDSQSSSTRPDTASACMALASSVDQWMRKRPTGVRACLLPSRRNARAASYNGLRGSSAFIQPVWPTPPRRSTLSSGNAFNTPSKSVYTTGTPMIASFPWIHCTVHPAYACSHLLKCHPAIEIYVGTVRNADGRQSD